MDPTPALAQRICEQARQLPETSLLELERYIEFLQFQAEHRHLLQERLASDYDEFGADSVILMFHVRTLDKARLIRRIGRLQAETMSKVDQAMALHLGLTLPKPFSQLRG